MDKCLVCSSKVKVYMYAGQYFYECNICGLDYPNDVNQCIYNKTIKKYKDKVGTKYELKYINNKIEVEKGR